MGKLSSRSETAGISKRAAPALQPRGHDRVARPDAEEARYVRAAPRLEGVGVFADDLRPSFETRPGVNGNGALSVYLDMLYRNQYVSIVKAANPLGFEYQLGPAYKLSNTALSGDAKTLGLVNEVGVTTLNNWGEPGDLAVAGNWS